MIILWEPVVFSVAGKYAHSKDRSFLFLRELTLKPTLYLLSFRDLYKGAFLTVKGDGSELFVGHFLGFYLWYVVYTMISTRMNAFATVMCNLPAL